MATFDTNYWNGSDYTPSDFSMQSFAPDWSSISFDSGPSATFSDWGGNYQQPNYYDQYAGYAPDWGSSPSPMFDASFMPGESSGIPSVMGGLGGMWDSFKGWLGAPATDGGEVTNGSKLLSAGIQGGLGALMGLGQARALDKARRKQAKMEAERAANAGKVAAQQRLDYLNGLRQDPNFRTFTVNAPERNVIANTGAGTYGASGGEHAFFDPAFLSKITTTPNAYKCGGLVNLHPHVKKKHMAHGGQADVVDARLAPGEYVLDADIVSALGDGSTDAGAARLDAMRENIRAHKRSGGLDQIPPMALNPEEYL